ARRGDAAGLSAGSQPGGQDESSAVRASWAYRPAADGWYPADRAPSRTTASAAWTRTRAAASSVPDSAARTSPVHRPSWRRWDRQYGPRVARRAAAGGVVVESRLDEGGSAVHSGREQPRLPGEVPVQRGGRDAHVRADTLHRDGVVAVPVKPGDRRRDRLLPGR